MNPAKARAPFVMWFTGGSEPIDHAISDDDMATGISVGTGRFLALCGETVCVASMICPPGRRCSPCEAAVQRMEHDPPPPSPRVPTQSRDRGRHRDDLAGAPAGAAHRLFSWLR